MNTAFDRDFARTLETEVGDAGEPNPEFYRTVLAQVRHRRRRRGLIAAGVAVCAVAAATGGVAVALARDSHSTPTADPTTSTSATPPPDPNRVPDWENLPTVRDVWPNAIRTLPGRLPDGSKYVVEAMLPDNRYVVLTWSEDPPGFKLSRPAVFDPAAGTVTVLAEMNGPSDFVLGVGVVGDLAVWVNHAFTGSGLAEYQEVWTAPLAGGPAKKLAKITGQGSYTIAGNYVMWDRYSNTDELSLGIFRLPVTGGQPQPVPNTRGFLLNQHYSGFGGTTAVAAKGSLAGGELIDLITGRRFSWTLSHDVPPNPAGTNHVFCGTFGCTGEWGTLSPAKINAVVQNLDGSGFMQLGSGSVGPVGDGRYVLYGFYDGPPNVDPRKPTGVSRVAIWDRTTGRAAICYSIQLASESDNGSIPGRGAGSRPFVTWGESGSLMLLDLHALGLPHVVR